jgi:uncharacterized protein YqgQ
MKFFRTKHNATPTLKDYVRGQRNAGTREDKCDTNKELIKGLVAKHIPRVPKTWFYKGLTNKETGPYEVDMILTIGKILFEINDIEYSFDNVKIYIDAVEEWENLYCTKGNTYREKPQITDFLQTENSNKQRNDAAAAEALSAEYYKKVAYCISKYTIHNLELYRSANDNTWSQRDLETYEKICHLFYLPMRPYMISLIQKAINKVYETPTTLRKRFDFIKYKGIYIVTERVTQRTFQDDKIDQDHDDDDDDDSLDSACTSSYVSSNGSVDEKEDLDAKFLSGAQRR